jgi:hypothetical protein
VDDICECHGAILPEEAGLGALSTCTVVDLDAPTVEIDTDDPLQQWDESDG